MPAERPGAAWALKLDGVATCVLLLMPLALAMSWPRLLAVWQTGTFFDTDDAMRMVEVRDWLSGQNWFDLVAHRLEPPGGLAMHWSRVIDVPIGILVRGFGLVADPIHAERLARLAFPLVLQAAMIGATAATARILAGPRAVMPAAFLILLSGIGYAQFQPGRIDHHAPQILLLMLATATTLLALRPDQARWAVVSGILIALSIGISLENLPFFAVLLSVPALSWAVAGESFRRTLLCFAAGLGAALIVVFAATVPPARYGVGACDALSIAHLTSLLAGAASLVALSLASPRIPMPRLRWAAVAMAGALVLGLMLAAYPACLHDPYAAMDPLVERLWLRNVTEAQPILTAVMLRPDTLTLLVLPLLAGALATLGACLSTSGLARARWLVVAALVVAGLGGVFWQVRVTSSAGPLALLGGAWAVLRTLDVAQRRGGIVYTALPLGAMCLFSTLAWAFVPIPDAWQGGASSSAIDSAPCRRPEAFEALAAQPPVLAFAPIESGSHILAHTTLRVLAAPYHRNQHGNRLVLEAFSEPPDAARGVVTDSGAGVLTFCRNDTHLRMIAKDAPSSLAAALLNGAPLSWLEPVASSDATYPIYRVR